MSNRTRNISLVLVAIAIVGVVITLENPFQTSNQAESPQIALVGNPAPNFILADVDGKPVSLDSFRGKVVIINFWATWCPYCIFEMPDLEQMYNMFSGDLIVLAINTGESKSKVRAFAEEIEMSYLILLDIDGKVEQAYGVIGYPPAIIWIEKVLSDKYGEAIMPYQKWRE